MKISFLSLVISLYWWCVSGDTSKNPIERIVGGHESVPYSRPYQISLQIRVFWVRLHVCGGSLLNENWVVTAAHCVKGSWLSSWIPMDAVAGAHNVNNFGPKTQIIAIEKRIVHPLYSGGIEPHDIALLKTKTPFMFTKVVQPIQLPPQGFNAKDGELLVLTGWGALKTSFLPDLPNNLQEVYVQLISYKECYKAVDEINGPGEKNPLDQESNICTGPLNKGVAACNGDSGGPLVIYMKNEESEEYENESDEIANFISSRENEHESDQIPVLLGIVSWGSSTCGDGGPTVYTKVSSHIDFINSIINER